MTQQLLQIRKYVCIFSWLSAVMVLLTLINHCSVLNTPKSSWSLSWTVLTNFLWQLVTMSTFRDSWSRWAFSVTVGQDEHFPWQLVNMSTFRDSWSRWALSVTLVQDEHFPWQLVKMSTFCDSWSRWALSVTVGQDEHFSWQLVMMNTFRDSWSRWVYWTVLLILIILILLMKTYYVYLCNQLYSALYRTAMSHWKVPISLRIAQKFKNPLCRQSCPPYLSFPCHLPLARWEVTPV